MRLKCGSRGAVRGRANQAHRSARQMFLGAPKCERRRPSGAPKTKTTGRARIVNSWRAHFANFDPVRAARRRLNPSKRARWPEHKTGDTKGVPQLVGFSHPSVKLSGREAARFGCRKSTRSGARLFASSIRLDWPSCKQARRDNSAGGGGGGVSSHHKTRRARPLCHSIARVRASAFDHLRAI